MNAETLNVTVKAKVRGLWKLALLTFLLRWKSAKHEINVTVPDGWTTH
jgi:hypothetical protein